MLTLNTKFAKSGSVLAGKNRGIAAGGAWVLRNRLAMHREWRALKKPKRLRKKILLSAVFAVVLKKN